jgi:hypothetical protein
VTYTRRAAVGGSVGTFLEQVFQRRLHLHAVLGAPHDRRLLQDVVAQHDAVALQARHRAADLGKPALQLEIRVVLVAQAALETPAHAGELRRVQREPLLLRHPDRHRLELPEPGRAAELAPARPDAAQHLRLVARADLLHLDAGVETGREVAHELAEVDAALGAEVEDRLARVEQVVDLHELHRQPAGLDAGETEPMGLAFALLVLLVSGEVARAGLAEHLRDVAALGLGGGRHAGNRRECERALALDDDPVAAREVECAAVVGVNHAGGTELDADQRGGCGLGRGGHVIRGASTSGSGSDCGWRSDEARAS